MPFAFSPKNGDHQRVNVNAGSGHDDDDLAGFGERVRAARLRIGLEQRELGALCETDGGTISRWELGKGYPQAKQLVKLANALGESLDYLVLGVPDKGPVQMPPAFVEFLKTSSGRIAQERAYIPTLLSVRLPGEPSIAFYRALLAALITADDSEER